MCWIYQEKRPNRGLKPGCEWDGRRGQGTVRGPNKISRCFRMKTVEGPPNPSSTPGRTDRPLSWALMPPIYGHEDTLHCQKAAYTWAWDPPPPGGVQQRMLTGQIKLQTGGNFWVSLVPKPLGLRTLPPVGPPARFERHNGVYKSPALKWGLLFPMAPVVAGNSAPSPFF